MAFSNSKSVRFPEDTELPRHSTGMPFSKAKLGKSEKKGVGKTGNSLKTKALLRVFSEDYERVKKKILSPCGQTIRKWNKIFLAACLVSLFVDPLFFYLPSVHDNICIEIRTTVKGILIVIRSIADVFYLIQIFIRFRTAYVAPSSRVFGRGELVIDSSKIAVRYLLRGFCIDLFAALPLPQLLILAVIPNLGGMTMKNAKDLLRLVLIFQYLPRLFLIFPLSSQIVKTTGVVTKNAWAGAAYNLMLYMLASHVLGSCWYLLSIERQEACWRDACDQEQPSCQYTYFDCRRMKDDPNRAVWLRSSNITSQCDPERSSYPFGIYVDAVTSNVTSALFFNKYFYCLWWGLKNLSSLGQNLITSTNVGEIGFAIIIATLGLVLFALLIGNMQTYLQSSSMRLEEWRIKRSDTEQWMHHRQLPQQLRQSVRKYDQFKWIAMRGVDEEAILNGLPWDIRRVIKRHLCYDLVRRVPLFDQMDERMLDAICERLKPCLCTKDSCLMREGDPVNEMLFIIRGNLDSYTTNGGRTGFFNSCSIGPGDFCGEELLTWALDSHPSIILPSSTRTVSAVSEVEAFALRAAELKFVAGQFRRLHSKQLRQKFRFYSPQWRTWAACFVQAAWRRYRKRINAAELKIYENETETKNDRLDTKTENNGTINEGSSGFSVYAAKLAANRQGVLKNTIEITVTDSGGVSPLRKPPEPDFSVDED